MLVLIWRKSNNSFIVKYLKAINKWNCILEHGAACSVWEYWISFMWYYLYTDIIMYVILTVYFVLQHFSRDCMLLCGTFLIQQSFDNNNGVLCISFMVLIVFGFLLVFNDHNIYYTQQSLGKLLSTMKLIICIFQVSYPLLW